MFQFFEDLPVDFLGVRGDDEEFKCGLASADDGVADKAAQKAVQHAQAHGFIVEDQRTVLRVFGVDEKGNKGDGGVDGKVDPEKIEDWILFADVLCHDVRSARTGIAAEGNAVDKTAHRPCDEYWRGGSPASAEAGS